MHVSGERNSSVVFSTGPCPHQKGNNVWTDNSGKDYSHSCTALAGRWTRHTSFPQASDPHGYLTYHREATDILLLQMQKPSRVQNSVPGCSRCSPSLVRTGVHRLPAIYLTNVDPKNLLLATVFHFTESRWLKSCSAEQVLRTLIRQQGQ